MPGFGNVVGTLYECMVFPFYLTIDDELWKFKFITHSLPGTSASWITIVSRTWYVVAMLSSLLFSSLWYPWAAVDGSRDGTWLLFSSQNFMSVNCCFFKTVKLGAPSKMPPWYTAELQPEGEIPHWLQCTLSVQEQCPLFVQRGQQGQQKEN